MNSEELSKQSINIPILKNHNLEEHLNQNQISEKCKFDSDNIKHMILVSNINTELKSIDANNKIETKIEMKNISESGK